MARALTCPPISALTAQFPVKGTLGLTPQPFVGTLTQLTRATTYLGTEVAHPAPKGNQVRQASLPLHQSTELLDCLIVKVHLPTTRRQGLNRVHAKWPGTRA